MGDRTLDRLPQWPSGTVAILTTGAGLPHAIPVSTAVRAGDRRLLFALALRRESLARLRRDGRCALTVVTAGAAWTAHGTADVVEDPMEAADAVAALALDVERIEDHDQPSFAIDAGVQWRWTDPGARDRDATIRAALMRLAAAE